MYSSTPSPKKKRPSRLSDIWLNSPRSFNDFLFTMKLQNLPNIKTKNTQISSFPNSDKTLHLPDPIMLKILSNVPPLHQDSVFLVCKRWLNLQGRLARSLRVFDWEFVQSGRVFIRFPNVTHLDLVPGCMSFMRTSGISVSFRKGCGGAGSRFLSKRDFVEGDVLSSEVVDRGLKVIASGYPNLRRLAVMNASEMGLLSLAEECLTLQELELHRCTDYVLRGIAACGNLQILKSVGGLDGSCGSGVSDVGLIILAQGCQRLVKLELSGCGGSFDGIKAIGQCCQMLEELMISDHRMQSGWFAAIPYCENLKTLKIQSCKSVDPGLDVGEDLGCCPALERLHLQRCHLRDKKSIGAVFAVCSAARELIIEDCWGLEDDIFSLSACCRRVKYLSLEGCSLLTTQGLESVILHWRNLERLRVVSCKNIKDSEISPALSNVFYDLKNFKWTPDTRSFISSARKGSGMGKRGGRFFKKILNLKAIPDDYGLHFDFIHR